MKPIEPAKNYRELPNRFVPNYPLQQGRDEAFYVPIYEDEIDELRDSILYDEIRTQTLFISGQTGTGKTTALHFLPDDEISKEFQVIFLNAKELFDLVDINIIEVLLMICHKLIENDGRLKDEFLKEVKRLDKLQKGALQENIVREAGVKGEIGGGIKIDSGKNPIARFLDLFSISPNFFASLKADKSYRKITREAFILNKLELLNLTNYILEKYIALQKRKSKVLLLINEMDHIKNLDLIRKLFIENRTFLKGIRCKKVISVPVVLIDYPEFQEKITFFCLKLKKNPVKGLEEISAQESDLIEQHREILQEVANKRMVQNSQLIQLTAIDKAIEASGGILRQFISILHDAAKRNRRMKGASVGELHVEYGMQSFRQMLERSVVMSHEKIELLNEVRISNQTQFNDQQAFQDCLLGNQVLVYMNTPTWYSVNPLIANTVRIYAQRGKVLEKKKD